jgi:hypothetical protein
VPGMWPEGRGRPAQFPLGGRCAASEGCRCHRLWYPQPLKYVEPSRFTDPNIAARNIEPINGAFLEAGGTSDQYRAALARAIALGWLSRHESGTYLRFTEAGADLFA